MPKSGYLFSKKSSIADVQLGSKYVSGINHQVLPICYHIYIFNPDLVEYFVKIIRYNGRLDIIWKLATYENQWEVSQLKIQ